MTKDNADTVVFLHLSELCRVQGTYLPWLRYRSHPRADDSDPVL